MTTDPLATGERVVACVADAETVTIVSPFVKLGALSRILDAVADTCAPVLFTRWRPAEVAQGISDLGVLDLIRDHQGEVFLNNRLHAKAYLTKTSALVGSANTSHTGLGWAPDSSIELLVDVDRADPSLGALLSTLRATSVRANDAIRDQVADIAGRYELPEPMPMDDIGGDVESLTGPSAVGLPAFPVPNAVWPALQGHRNDAITSAVVRDLQVLGVPLALRSEEELHSLVALAMLQGPCAVAIETLKQSGTALGQRDLLARLLRGWGLTLSDEEITNAMRALVQWASHFLPGAARHMEEPSLNQG